MPVTYTPLRYPGGKTKLYEYVRKILRCNGLIGTSYCEPFAGGAGLAIKLLIKNDVDNIFINDADPAIYSIWNLIINSPDKICDFIKEIPITIEEWNREKKIYATTSDPDELGLAAFFLNRTNVSGIISGGVIGGINQNGNYRIDARFNRDNLIKKINNISSKADKIHLSNMDVIDFMHYMAQTDENMLVNFDPPYVNKGGALYRNYFDKKDHIKLHDAIKNFKKKWIVTYDYCEFIQKLYEDFNEGTIDVYYSANRVRKANEYIIYSDDLIIPE
jgi:DNA adenine methylase